MSDKRTTGETSAANDKPNNPSRVTRECNQTTACCSINAHEFPLPSATDVIHCWCLADSIRELLGRVRTADGPIFMPLDGGGYQVMWGGLPASWKLPHEAG